MMRRWRLRTKFLFWMVVVSATVTSATLLLVRRAVENRLRGQILNDLHNSVSTYRSVQRQRQSSLRHTSELVADLPISRALMSTKHPATIQDGSADLWRLAGTDLLVMADRSGAVLGLQTNGPRFEAAAVSESLRKTNAGADSWWFGGGHLYEVSVQPIYFGAPAEERITGFLAIGSDIDDRAADELAEVAGVEVAFCYGDQLVRSTLAADQTAILAANIAAGRAFAGPQPSEIELGKGPFLVSSVLLEGESARPVRLIVLKSLREANAFIRRMDSLLLGLGLLALVAGSLVVFVISRAFTLPLERLVDGVRALGGGDYEYPLPSGGDDEIAELTAAFVRMRSSLRESQKELLQSERLATIGRMASSISHDLRHHLVAVLANAEYLMDDRNPEQRQELYDELRAGVGQMTDLIDSLLELSRPRESLHVGKTSLDEIIERALQTVQAYTQFCNIDIEVHGSPVDGWFDANKLQRVFQNLLVNACEAVPQSGGGRVDVTLTTRGDSVEARVSDNGRGISDELREKIFDAFVSYGKENGTGLGLTVVRKIVQDHGGVARVESTGSGGTVMLVTLPLSVSGEGRVRRAAAQPASTPLQSS